MDINEGAEPCYAESMPGKTMEYITEIFIMSKKGF